mmetsp:Transcript_68621/g.196816  ORF Transcript_68621/g.196816 Transcript_68621/m.196816 type:complete len:351 (+) Transcript_68621:138-1190(+)
MAQSSVERLQLVRLDRRLVLMQVRERVLGAVVVRVVVGVDRLRLQAGDRVELLDGRCAQLRQGPKHRALNLGDFGVLDGINQSVLGLRGMVLQLLGGVLLAKRRDLVEVHLEIVRHLLSELVLRSLVVFALPHLQEACRLVLLLLRCWLVLGSHGLETLHGLEVLIDLCRDLRDLLHLRQLCLRLLRLRAPLLQRCLCCLRHIRAQLPHALLCSNKVTEGGRLLARGRLGITLKLLPFHGPLGTLLFGNAIEELLCLLGADILARSLAAALLAAKGCSALAVSNVIPRGLEANLGILQDDLCDSPHAIGLGALALQEVGACRKRTQREGALRCDDEAAEARLNLHGELHC